MWQELVWNVDFLRGLIFFAFGILVAILLIPWVLKRLQAQRDKRLAKALLRQWGHICIGAITALKPDTETEQKARFELFDSGDWDLSGYVSTEQIIDDLWENIRNGKRKPDDSAMIINNALEKVLYSDEERTSKGLPPEKKYPFPSSRAVPRSWLRRILNPMYAKIEIFDVELLPIGELEMAVSYLDSFSQQGHFTRHQFMSYALHLAQSMEKFAEYLWKLENWANEPQIEEELPNTQRTATSHLGICIGLCALWLISNGWPGVVVGSTALLFLISTLIVALNKKRTRAIVRRLLRIDVSYLPLFLGLVSLVVVCFQKNLEVPGRIFFVGAYGFLIYRIVKPFVKPLWRKGTHR